MEDNVMTGIKIPEPSDWTCYMFGNKPLGNQGICYIPIKGQVPNFFVRWMMKICFACTWVRAENKKRLTNV